MINTEFYTKVVNTSNDKIIFIIIEVINTDSIFLSSNIKKYKAISTFRILYIILQNFV